MPLNELFYSAFINSLLKNSSNFYIDNPVARLATPTFYETLRNLFRKIVYTKFKNSLFTVHHRYPDYEKHIEEFAFLYDLLEDKQSKDLLIHLLTYYILGCLRVKLPGSTTYSEMRPKVKSLFQKESIPAIIPPTNKVNKINLKPLGYPIELYGILEGIISLFFCKQYQYASPQVQCKVEPGDYVIDAGGCWGDTALYFAYMGTETSKVFCFEFVPGQIEIIKKNLELNPHLNERVTIVTKPLWSKSGVFLYHTDQGPATKVSKTEFTGYAGRTETISIDDFVEKNAISKVDFIKMDIEGAEPEALKGAVNTLKRFRPKLAISIYHNINHFWEIPRIIKSVELGYTFYLGHYSIFHEETILYAIPPRQ